MVTFLLFGIEHAAIFLGLLILYVVSPVPHWVSVEMERQEYNKKEALRDKLEASHARLRASVQTGLGKISKPKNISKPLPDFDSPIKRKTRSGGAV